MKVADAEREILAAWRKWRADTLPPDRKPTGTDALLFYGHLQSEKPHLLTFAFRGDKWQRVHGWLLSNSEVSD